MRSRQRVRWAQLRVTAITAVSLVILGVLLYLLTGGMLFKEQATLYLYIPDASGLTADLSPVTVSGITVGKVSNIVLSGSYEPKRVVRVTLVVARDMLAIIPVGSFAQLETDPFGAKWVEITAQGRGPMPPKSEVPYQEQSDLLKTLDFATFEQNLRQMDAILTEIENGRGLVGQFVMGTDLYTQVRQKLIELEKGVRVAANTTGMVGQEIYTERLYRQVMAPLTDFDQALARLQSGQGVGQYLRDTAAFDNAAATIRAFQASIAGIRSSPYLQSDETYTSLSTTIEKLARSVDEVNAGPLFAAPLTYDNLNGVARELESTLKDFRGNPKKYLRIKVF
jgi:phospholipid/cholesterol/gamma-HCH transport system substrate-binding protein